MNSYQYDNPLRMTYRFAAAALASAAIVGRVIGPKGKVGRVAGLEVITTTATTVAACTLTVGPNGAASPVNLDIPITAINLGVAIERDEDTLIQQTELAADTLVEITAGGECTAGAGDLLVTIEWY